MVFLYAYPAGNTRSVRPPTLPSATDPSHPTAGPEIEPDEIKHDTSPYDALSNDRQDTVSQPTLFSRQSPSDRDGSERLHVTDSLEALGNGRNRPAGGCEVVIVGGSDDGDRAAGAAAAGASAATRAVVRTDIPTSQGFSISLSFSTQLQHRQTTTNIDAVYIIVSAFASSI
jgi:hypothetical protein